MVVIAMKRIRKLHDPGIITHPMKNKAVGNVFKKGPEEHSPKESSGYPP
jgi:hypothetical protein